METPPQNVSSLDGQDVTIICRAFGAPNPNTTWTFNGKFIRWHISLCKSMSLSVYRHNK